LLFNQGWIKLKSRDVFMLRQGSFVVLDWSKITAEVEHALSLN